MNLSIQTYWELSKPRILFMVLVTTTIGYLLGGDGLGSWSSLLITLLGTALAAGGASALNNFLERDLDARMNRTRNRALPAGRLEPGEALTYGVVMVLGGVTLLAWVVNLLTAFLVLLTAFLYVLVYTPLKRLTWLNTSVGAIPGAVPPMSGWAAAHGELELGAWILFFILFAWQHPHFYSIAWMYKDDYRRAGYKMLPYGDPSGKRLFQHTLAYSVILLGVSVWPALIGMMGGAYWIGSLLLGLFLLGAGWNFARSKAHADARRLLKASVLYLLALLGLIMVDFVF